MTTITLQSWLAQAKESYDRQAPALALLFSPDGSSSILSQLSLALQVCSTRLGQFRLADNSAHISLRSPPRTRPTSLLRTSPLSARPCPNLGRSPTSSQPTPSMHVTLTPSRTTRTSWGWQQTCFRSVSSERGLPSISRRRGRCSRWVVYLRTCRCCERLFSMGDTGWLVATLRVFAVAMVNVSLKVRPQ